MPKRQFIRSRKAWYDTVAHAASESEEFMLSFFFADDSQFDEDLDGQIALRYHASVDGWRLEAFDQSMKLVSHFNDILVALAAKDANYSGDDLEKLLVDSGVLDKTARVAPPHVRGHPLLHR